jgi:ATP-binding cassette, subfamily A (ABC1), member 3
VAWRGLAGADVIADFEYSGVGLHWDNYTDGYYSFQSSLHMMFLDFWLYLFLAWYFDKVLPSEFGVAEHPLFFLMPAYWMGHSSGGVSLTGLLTGLGFTRLVEGDKDEEEEAGVEADAENARQFYEEAPPAGEHAPRVVVSGLAKRYKDGNLAVKGVSFTMYDNMVTCLLGHNGAGTSACLGQTCHMREAHSGHPSLSPVGKTTTISLITGLFPPTKGDVTIWGKSIRHDLDQVRADLGVCPQVNVLWSELTVREHLTFFALLKGMPSRDLSRLVSAIGAQGATFHDCALMGWRV